MTTIYSPNANEVNDFHRHGILKVDTSRINSYGGYEIDLSKLKLRGGFVWIKKDHPTRPCVIVTTRKGGMNHPAKKCLGVVGNGRDVERIFVGPGEVGKWNYGERFRFFYDGRKV